jgi:hypothetical protein
MTATRAFVIGRFRLQRINLRQRVDADPPRHRCVAADLRDRIDDTIPHRGRGVPVSFKVLGHADRVNDGDLLQRILQDDAATQHAGNDDESIDRKLARPLEQKPFW